MFKIYSKGCEYALRALARLRLLKPGEVFLIRDLCRKAGVPEASTRKSFQKLAASGLLEANPGPGGGYRLTEDTGKISLLDVILSVDGDDAFEKCVMGLRQCSDKKPCPLHNNWQTVKKILLEELKRKNLSDLTGSAV